MQIGHRCRGGLEIFRRRVLWWPSTPTARTPPHPHAPAYVGQYLYTSCRRHTCTRIRHPSSDRCRVLPARLRCNNQPFAAEFHAFVAAVCSSVSTSTRRRGIWNGASEDVHATRRTSRRHDGGWPASGLARRTTPTQIDCMHLRLHMQYWHCVIYMRAARSAATGPNSISPRAAAGTEMIANCTQRMLRDDVHAATPAPWCRRCLTGCGVPLAWADLAAHARVPRAYCAIWGGHAAPHIV
ncbi:hypothetical protein FA95DRAFT_501649 [Auriscalpium vulgare]|uniref:Uncharacterized protein n=1 Tax=Auriscalpium vulgare TaxID=40419 RepID=A0ACB8S3U6_9AGAM|nr:hypothetical protein FA95DRAFT_501649 [Auriscalpium vulgare]